MDMDLIRDAIDRLELRIAGSGSEDAIVSLVTDPDAIYCQYEKGPASGRCTGGDQLNSSPMTRSLRRPG
jgi:hypothetical protein